MPSTPSSLEQKDPDRDGDDTQEDEEHQVRTREGEVPFRSSDASLLRIVLQSIV